LIVAQRVVEDVMANSKQVGALVGPTMVAVLLSEFPLIQPHLYDAQIPPVVYLSGVLMFVAGLAILRAHNVWARNWTVLVTLSGWVCLLLGLVRMFAASQYQQAASGATPLTFMLLEVCLLVVALAITFKSYTRGGE
jgi:multisubunit Na+/H+ antiporter MnhG subunit